MGVVGNAMSEALKELSHNIMSHDKNKDSIYSIEDLKKCDYIYLCLPTPMKTDGSIDMSAFEDVLPKLDGYKNLVFIKSTVLPKTTETYSNKYDLKLVSHPEFLREKYAVMDAKNPDKLVFGYDGDINEVVDAAQNIYKSVLSTRACFFMDSYTSEFSKYTSNCFLASKVIFANAMKKECDKLDIDWERIKNVLICDERIGNSHLDVTKEGGFGGMCFPKDLNAFYQFTKNDFIGFVLKKNKDFRGK